MYKVIVYAEIIILLVISLIYGLSRIDEHLKKRDECPNIIFVWNNHSFIKWPRNIEHNPDCPCITNIEYYKEHNPG